jgi:hypothetical protein
MSPHPDPEAILADCEQRALEREGIPMFLALEDLTGRFPGAAQTAEGARLAELTGHYAGRLRPDAEDGDLAALASVITVLARVHFGETV